MIPGLQFPPRTSGPATWLWVGSIGVASILLSRAFACATPFAALATLAAFTLRGRQAMVLMLFVWLANQAVGFGLLGYPWTFSSFAWGLAIGIAALAGLLASRAIAPQPMRGRWIALPLTLVAAFAAYEAVLYATTWLLPAWPGAFAAPVVLRIFAINGVALGLLLAAQLLAHVTAIRLQAQAAPLS